MSRIQAVGRACDIFNLLRASDGAVKLADIAAAVDLSSATAFRLVDTLRAKGLVERVQQGGYRIAAARAQKPDPLRIGFAAQTSEFAFSRTVTQSVLEAAQAAHVELMVANNRYSRSIALKNADHFVRAKVDLVIEFQTFAEIAPAVASKYHHAGIPLIAVEIPHPGATYFGADNYRAGMRDLDGDQRNAGVVILRRDRRRDLREGLEFDDEIDFGADEVIGVLQRDRSAIAIVGDHQLDARGLRRFEDALRHGARERELGGLRGKADAQRIGLRRTGRDAIAALRHALDEALRAQRIDETKRRRARQVDGGGDVRELYRAI